MRLKLFTLFCFTMTACSQNNTTDESVATFNENAPAVGETVDMNPAVDDRQLSAEAADSTDPIIRLVSSPDFSFNPELKDASACDQSQYNGVTFHICENMPLQPCPFSDMNECEVESAVFAGDKLGSVSFKYDPTDFQLQRFTKVAGKHFGVGKVETKGPPGAGVDMTMTTRTWKARNLRITVIDTAGVNFNGEDYHDVSAIFRNTSVPDPMSR